MKEKNRKKDFIDELSQMLPKERVERAQVNANKEIFSIKLSELRKQMGIKQEEIKSFSQSGISRLESRKDMKISTLIEYLENIGMGLEIKVYPKATHNKNEEVTLLKA
jgi:glycosylphosphatidylinositol transamidase (GPIT) subunit GPI8